MNTDIEATAEGTDIEATAEGIATESGIRSCPSVWQCLMYCVVPHILHAGQDVPDVCQAVCCVALWCNMRDVY